MISILKEKVAWKLDKYDMKISMEQIQTLVEKKKYKQASDLAKTLNWHKVKDWPSLSAAIKFTAPKAPARCGSVPASACSR